MLLVWKAFVISLDFVPVCEIDVALIQALPFLFFTEMFFDLAKYMLCKESLQKILQIKQINER